jgi:4-hydroxybenzoate polyprenyltransferase and related prenyltransferases
MSYTLRGRLESRLAALALPLAAACALGGVVGHWWPVELAGLMVAVGLAADLVYFPALPYQPGWAALPLGLLELGALMGLVVALGLHAPLAVALALFGGGWIWSQVLGQALLPLWRWGYAEDGGELGVAGAALAVGICLPFAASGGLYWHNLPPTVTLSSGVHMGPLYVDRRERLVGAPGAIVLGGIVVRHDDVTVSHVTVIGGENGISVNGFDGIELDHVTVRRARLDGIHVRRAAVMIRDCTVDMRGVAFGQGIDVSYNSDRGMTLVDGCTVVGGQDGIVAHSSMAMLRHNHVSSTLLRGISLTEMSMGEVEHNDVRNALGIGILCGDRSMCTIDRNSVADTHVDTASGGPMRAGVGIEVEFGAEAELGTNELTRSKGGVGSFLGSTIQKKR